MENILRELLNTEIVIIYGVGLYGRTLKEWLDGKEDYSKKKTFMAVTEPNEYEIYDKDVCCIRDLVNYADSALVVVAVSEEKQGEMIENLKALSFRNIYPISKQFYEYIRIDANFHNGKIMELVEANMSYSREIIWGINLDRALAESKWMNGKTLKANGAAVSNYYLYILYKALDSGLFHSLLDIGMGQTTKLLSQYVRTHADVRHIVVENDKEWIVFAKRDLDLCEKTDIVCLETGFGGSDGRCRVYNGFSRNLNDLKFDLISIDGPQGYDMKSESRIDILDMIPDCLNESWIIMMDDVGRIGEKNTFFKLLEKLDKHGIVHQYAMYEGMKKFAICTSIDNRFYCTV